MQMQLRKCFGILALFCTLLLWSGCTGNSDGEGLDLQESDRSEGSASDIGGEHTEEKEKEEEPGVIVVHVCGCVSRPGVYELPKGSRIYEALEAAGGTSAGAAADILNQASVVEDGQQIYIPSAEEVSGQTREGFDPAGIPDDGKINLNTAGEEELMTLTGIGEAKAASIIRYRQENGKFDSIEELMEVDGIKEGVFEKIKDQVKV